MKHHDRLWKVCPKRAEDYTPYGKDERWADPNRAYPDCSCGCKFYYVLEERDGQDIGCDWGVCTNPKSHRVGLLTFEHQGCEHFKQDANALRDCAIAEAPVVRRVTYKKVKA